MKLKNLSHTQMAIDIYKRIYTPSNCDDIIIKPFRNIGANLNWYINDNLKEFVLKRYSNKNKDYFINQDVFLCSLNQNGIPIPKNIEKDGKKAFYLNGYWWQLMEFVKGRQFKTGSLKDVINAATLLKKIHNIPFDGDMTIKTLHDPISWLDNPDIELDMLKKVMLKYNKFDSSLFNEIKMIVKEIILKCSLSTYFDLPYAIVHGDYHGNNLLFDEDGNICCLLDLESVNYSTRVTDVAQGAFLMARVNKKTNLINKELARLFLDFYGDLTKLELQMLVPILQLRFLPRAQYIEELGKSDIKKIDNEIAWSINAFYAIENQMTEIIDLIYNFL